MLNTPASGTLIERVTISDGYADGVDSIFLSPIEEFQGGGGIRIEGGVPEFVDVTIRDNFANGAPNGFATNVLGGGGVACFGGSPAFTRCTFIGNDGEAREGGAVWLTDADEGGETADFIDCVFTDNEIHAIGGAISSNQGYVLTVDGCQFANNRTVDLMGVGQNGVSYGGAIRAFGGSDSDTDEAFILNSTFTANTTTIPGESSMFSSFGGAVHLDGFAGRIEGCEFAGNASDDHGGAVSAFGAATIIDCSFTTNTAASPGIGGAIYLDGGVVDIEDCVFTENEAMESSSGTGIGGAIGMQISGGPGDPPANARLRRCVFVGNHADADGGAIHAGTLEIVESCVFEANTTGTTPGLSGEGGAVWIYARSSETTDNTFVNCLFFDNASANGGAVRHDGNGSTWFLSFVNCTFADNVADSSGGAYSDADTSLSTTIEFRNCILWNNSANGSSTSSDSQIGPSGAHADIDVDDTLIQNGWSGLSETSTILSTDPRFEDAASGDFRLRQDTDARDSGDNSEIPSGISTDLGSGPRIIANTVDIGAYERCFVDYASPFGVLDYSDVIEFLILFNANDSRADLDQPRGVWDYSDVIKFNVLTAKGCGS